MRKFGRTPRWGGRLSRAADQLAASIRAGGDRLFREQDASARRHGWDVQVRHGGLSRTYRDPRFDRLQACPACRGAGTGEHDRACDRCHGTGRIRLGEPVESNAGRGR
jgi:RecJ-like exonuclease